MILIFYNMSHIFTYSKESFSDARDPKERAVAIRSESGMTKSLVLTKKVPRVKAYLGKDSVTVPLAYLLRCRISKWLDR